MNALRLVAAIGLFLQLAAPVAAFGRGSRVPRVLPPDPRRFESEILAFAAADSAARPPEGAVVFYGSSSIRMWHDRLAADFAPLRVVGRGFGGSTMSEAAWWVDRVVAPLRPWAVVLYEGDNDIEMGRLPTHVVADFDLLVAKLRTKVPGVRIFVLSIKPSGARWAKWGKMQATNAMLAAACGRPDSRMTFVDVATPMIWGGLPRPEMYLEDRLHLTPAGYDAWRSVLQPKLREAAEVAPDAALVSLPAPRIRIRNASDVDFEDVVVGGKEYGDMKRGASTGYQTWELAYRYSSVKLTAGKPMGLVPLDFVGETPIRGGNFTYVITIREGNLDIQLVRDGERPDRP